MADGGRREMMPSRGRYAAEADVDVAALSGGRGMAVDIWTDGIWPVVGEAPSPAPPQAISLSASEREAAGHCLRRPPDLHCGPWIRRKLFEDSALVVPTISFSPLLCFRLHSVVEFPVAWPSSIAGWHGDARSLLQRTRSVPATDRHPQAPLIAARDGTEPSSTVLVAVCIGVLFAWTSGA